jgi:formate/nitrite transporter FocA (FNT family)
MRPDEALSTPGDEQAEREEQKQKDEQRAEEHTAPGAGVVHEAIRREGEDELKRPSSALAWSALAAGLSMGFSFVAEGLLHSMLPDAPWRPLLAKLGYSVGFVIVILGRQQLFSENTLTVILPLLQRRDGATLRNVCRLWAVVLCFNLLGALLFAWAIGKTAAFEISVQQSFAEIGRAALQGDFGTTLLRGVFAGWLIALMIWLLPLAESSRVHVIILLTFLVGLGGFPHIIAGSIEVLYLVVTGAVSWSTYLGGYMAPTLIGNILGGVALVAIVNHAQVVAGGGEDV